MARANGRYPLAGQLVIDPGSPAHLVARATFGILDSRDAGKTWTWICEDALGPVAQAEDPTIAVTADGTTLVAFSQGLSVSKDGCCWKPATGLLGGRFAVDVALDPRRPHEALVIEVVPSAGSYDLHLAKTVDDGATWTEIGKPLTGFLGTTVDVAPSDPARIYISGQILATQENVIERSDDGGQSFTPVALAGVPPSVSAYIGAIDRQNPDVLYVRVPPSVDSGGQLLVSSDGAATFRRWWTLAGDIAGFALSPDGGTLALGGPEGGLYLGSTSDGTFLPMGTIKPSCLTWNDEGLFACGKESVDSFSIGVSRDGGAHFAPVLHFPNIAPRACPTSSSASVCRAQWSPIAAAIGADAGEGQGSEAGSAAEPGADPVSSGCGCRFARPAAASQRVVTTLVLGFLVACRRRASKLRYGAVQR